MPFTFAHPAAIIPFRKLGAGWWSWTGLIVGSMIPDFEGFIRVGHAKRFSHTWDGMFWFDLPLGLIVCFIFHLLVRDTLIDQLPAMLRARLIKYRGEDWVAYFKKNVLPVLLSLLVGILTHILWDRITHTDTYHYPSRVGFELDIYQNYRLRQWLQILSSILGLILIAWQLSKLSIHDVDPNHRIWLPYWIIIVTPTVLVLVIAPGFGFTQALYANAVIAGILGGMLLASVAHRLLQRSKS